MTFCRTAFLFVFVVASCSAFAADPNSSAASPHTSFQLSTTTPETGQLVPWYTGMKRADLQVNSDVSAKNRLRHGAVQVTPGGGPVVSCLTLRTYKVKRQERLSDNESGFRGYSTCQAVSNYQVRSAVGGQTLQVPPQ